jgi:MscS family membrane protein
MNFLTKEFYGNPVEKWLLAFVIVVGSILLAKLTYWIIGKTVKQVTSRTKTKLDDILVDQFEEPAVMAIVLICCWYAANSLHLAPSVQHFLQKAFVFALVVDITWFVSRTIDSFIDEYLAPYAQKSETRIDDTLLPILKKGVRGIIWSIGIIMGLNNAGFDVAALVAGLGIGGLALALASQDTVKNIIGGLIIILDKPFKIGDRIVIDALDGTIEDIGVRSTRMRTLDKREVTIPNMIFSDKPIINVTREPARKVVMPLGLIYDTTPEKMQLAVDTLKKIANAHPLLDEEATNAFFSNFGAHSLDITLIYYIQAGNDYFKVQNEINQAILSQFNALELEFAFPTQTIYSVKQNA